MTLVDNLYKQHANLIRSCGGKENFTDYLSSQPQAYVDYILPIVNHEGPYLLINPWNQVGNLGTIDSRSRIISSEPYRVFTRKGELLYSVSNHYGYFGYSNLDKALINQSRTLDLFFIEYQSYEGPKVTLLAVCKFMPISQQQESNQNLREQQSKTIDQILIKVTSAYVDPQSPSQEFSPISIYFLESFPHSIPTPPSIKDNPLSVLTAFDTNSTEIVLPIEDSGWIVINQNIEDIDYYLNIIPSGDGYKRVVKVSDYLYYIALPKDLTLQKIRQIFDQPELNEPHQDVENLNLTLSIII
jgi:hypothetical protein